MKDIKLKLTIGELQEFVRILQYYVENATTVLNEKEYVHFFNLKKLAQRLFLRWVIAFKASRIKSTVSISASEAESVIFVYKNITAFTDHYRNMLIINIISELDKQLEAIKFTL